MPLWKYLHGMLDLVSLDTGRTAVAVAVAVVGFE